jgi:hypothetical protein
VVRTKKEMQNSKAKKILFKFLRDMTVPRVQYISNCNEIMTIEEIYHLDDHEQKYKRDKCKRSCYN